MNDGWANDALDQLRGTFRVKADAMGVDVVADIRQSLSVPVEHQGSKVIRSQPGDPPRQDKGDLGATVTAVVEPTDGGDQLVVSSDNVILSYLERGTEHIEPRPSFAPAFQRWIDPATEALGSP